MPPRRVQSKVLYSEKNSNCLHLLNHIQQSTSPHTYDMPAVCSPKQRKRLSLHSKMFSSKTKLSESIHDCLTSLFFGEDGLCFSNSSVSTIRIIAQKLKRNGELVSSTFKNRRSDSLHTSLPMATKRRYQCLKLSNLYSFIISFLCSIEQSSQRTHRLK